ncbi:universal stress protein [Balneatrix alpica]|uniref:Universal stress protein n=1 Tax=Balneatrix alpica TaxID=75684 RepID=A0ABV5ZBP0_9GAMM|nr:universal stress protein [Balneatrix alpica]
MQFNRTLLVVLERHDEHLTALNRACLIAQRLGCQVKVLSWQPEADEENYQPQSLQVLMQQWQEQGVQLSLELLNEPDLAEAVLRVQAQEQAGLLVKECESRHTHLPWRSPADWQLLRQCPCPVLLVKRDGVWQGGKVLAAIEAQPRDQRHAQLNQGVLALATFVTQAIEGQLHIVSAYPPPMQAGEPEDQAEELLAARWQQACEQLTAQARPQPSAFHIGEGPAEHWIPQVAAEQAANLVVLGTVGRAQFIGALLGNTAERILDSLNADVMVLQPDSGLAICTLLHPPG